MTVVAGAVRFHLTTFVATMVVASPIRASIYALLGGSVLDLNLGRVLLITLGIIAIAVLPFLHPKTRQMLLGEQSQ
jgi:membrane protein DedA with SNARE-associated domain